MESVFRRALVALIAVFALGSLVSASAFAELPEFVGTKPNAFTGSGGQIFIEERSHSQYQCTSGSTSSSITGTITGPKEVSNVVIKFPACDSFCRTLATKALETKELKGRIAYLNKKEKSVGLLLEPVAEPVAECVYHSGLSAKVQGSIIGRLVGLNIKQKTPFHLEFQQVSGRQTLQHFDGEELLHNLRISSFPFTTSEEFGLQSTMTFSTTREVEIRA